MLKHLALAVIFFAAFNVAEACLEVPKTIKLLNSPFSFGEFKINSNSFQYVTPDGMTNTLICVETKGVTSWGASTVSVQGATSLYSHEDLLKESPFNADDKEKEPKTAISLNKDSPGVLKFTKAPQKHEISVRCQLKDKVMTMSVELKNEKDVVVGKVYASKMQATRSLAIQQEEIDFKSSRETTISVGGCGASVIQGEESGTTDPEQQQPFSQER